MLFVKSSVYAVNTAIFRGSNIRQPFTAQRLALKVRETLDGPGAVGIGQP
jgi:hypothetical protein